jgi:plasmid maintenance system antidote protein VapI
VALSQDLAIRLELAGVGTARFWMGLQANYDLGPSFKHDQPPVKTLQHKVA